MSRLLEIAVAEGIVRTTVLVPEGLYAELEERLEARYGLREAHVFDVSDSTDDTGLVKDLGRFSASGWSQTRWKRRSSGSPPGAGRCARPWGR